MKTKVDLVNDNTSFRDDLGMDEFDLFQLFLELETMGMCIDYRKTSKITTIRELKDSIHYL